MAKEIKKEILVSVIFPIIVGIILMILEPTRNFIIMIIINAWNFIAFLFTSIFRYLVTNHEINGLLLLLLILLSTAFIIFIFLFFIETLKGKTYKHYREDVFFGLNWRWNWGHTGIEDLWCYCPKCDFELTYNDSSTHRYSTDRNPRTDFICDHCQSVVGSVPKQNKDYIIGIIEREIRRKVRNNLHINKKDA